LGGLLPVRYLFFILGIDSLPHLIRSIASPLESVCLLPFPGSLTVLELKYTNMSTSIWQIIPQITSPLAVICFALYIFYLIKRSKDLKQIKTLDTDDPIARKIATELILRDYSDVQIDTITDQGKAFELAKQIIDNRFKHHRKTMNSLLVFTLIFAFTYLGSLLIGKAKNFEDLITVNDESWAVKQAVKSSKKYAMLSVTLHIRLDDILKDSLNVRRALFRTHYTIKALEDINITDKVFPEQYYSNVIPIEQWAGSEKQDDEVIDGAFYVKFAAKKNEIKSLTTGANYFYPTPLAKNNKTCFGIISILDDEWVWCYPNSEDFIDNLSIIVESENVNIDLPDAALLRSDDSGNISTADGTCRKIKSKNECTTLVARWQNLNPNECAAFKIRWSFPEVNPGTVASITQASLTSN
jgi:hypothetical protein